MIACQAAVTGYSKYLSGFYFKEKFLARLVKMAGHFNQLEVIAVLAPRLMTRSIINEVVDDYIMHCKEASVLTLKKAGYEIRWTGNYMGEGIHDIHVFPHIVNFDDMNHNIFRRAYRRAIATHDMDMIQYFDLFTQTRLDKGVGEDCQSTDSVIFRLIELVEADDYDNFIKFLQERDQMYYISHLYAMMSAGGTHYANLKKWYIEQELPGTFFDCITFASFNNLELLKVCQSRSCNCSPQEIMSTAIGYGYQNIIEYMLNTGLFKTRDLYFSFDIFRMAQLPFLKYLLDNGCGWSEDSFGDLAQQNLEIFRWGLENGCPLTRNICDFPSDADNLDYLLENHIDTTLVPKRHVIALGERYICERNLNCFRLLVKHGLEVDEVMCQAIVSLGMVRFLRFIHTLPANRALLNDKLLRLSRYMTSPRCSNYLFGEEWLNEHRITAIGF
jgi:hypothetical protein